MTTKQGYCREHLQRAELTRQSCKIKFLMCHTKYLTKSNSALIDNPEIIRTMHYIQSKLSSFFRRSSGGEDD